MLAGEAQHGLRQRSGGIVGQAIGGKAQQCAVAVFHGFPSRHRFGIGLRGSGLLQGITAELIENVVGELAHGFGDIAVTRGANLAQHPAERLLLDIFERRERVLVAAFHPRHGDAEQGVEGHRMLFGDGCLRALISVEAKSQCAVGIAAHLELVGGELRRLDAQDVRRAVPVLHPRHGFEIGSSEAAVGMEPGLGVGDPGIGLGDMF